MKPREGMRVDPAQVPTDLKEPAMGAGQPPSMRRPVTFDDSADDSARVVRMRPVDESEDIW